MVNDYKLTNMRSATSEATVTLAKARNLSLDEAMEFCGQDECVEVTPQTIRVRKVLLHATDRARARSKAKQRNG